jgi:prolyl-tRNA synthetase
MKYSKLLGKTIRKQTGKVKKLRSKHAELLSRAGFIDQHMAGVYSYLPLGFRVVNKIENIIREEMDNIGGQELRLPSLHSATNWKKTGRWDTYDTLFKFKSHLSKLDLAISPTHEEVVTPLVKGHAFSYKDLPIAPYQIETKFRDETRPTLGLSRLREFRMKDMYSFHTTKEDLYNFYDIAKDAYWNIFERVGLKELTYLTLASGGDFTDEFTHEFQTIGDNGQDLIFHCKKCKVTYNREVAPSSISKQVATKEKRKKMKAILGKEVERTTKTLLFETEKGNVIAVAVRGDYSVNEEKLKNVTGYKELKLAPANKVIEVTNAKIGYAGIVGLPKDIEVYLDDSMKGRVNFECGGNKTDYHNINVNFGRDIPMPKKFYDFKLSKKGDLCPKCKEKYSVFRALENANIFPLETKFSKAFNLNYKDKDGKEKIVYMGCYGIGPDRLISSIAENLSDEYGLVWPITVAPYQVHLVILDKTQEKGEDLYSHLLKEGIEVLYDDREDVSAGVKLNDADLIGIPIRIIISKRSLSRDGVEIKTRGEKDSTIVELDKVVGTVKQRISILEKDFIIQNNL